MQLYYGLPVITNKITDEETKGIPHHLLGCIGLEQETWTVGKFVSNALTVVSTVVYTALPSRSDLARSTRFAVGASFLSLLAVLTTTLNHCCSRMRSRKNLRLI